MDAGVVVYVEGSQRGNVDLKFLSARDGLSKLLIEAVDAFDNQGLTIF